MVVAVVAAVVVVVAVVVVAAVVNALGESVPGIARTTAGIIIGPISVAKTIPTPAVDELLLLLLLLLERKCRRLQ
jgi:hypothetical protein